jgi:hypothetical protein
MILPINRSLVGARVERISSARALEIVPAVTRGATSSMPLAVWVVDLVRVKITLGWVCADPTENLLFVSKAHFGQCRLRQVMGDAHYVPYGQIR